MWYQETNNMRMSTRLCNRISFHVSNADVVSNGCRRRFVSGGATSESYWPVSLSVERWGHEQASGDDAHLGLTLGLQVTWPTRRLPTYLRACDTPAIHVYCHFGKGYMVCSMPIPCKLYANINLCYKRNHMCLCCVNTDKCIFYVIFSFFIGVQRTPIPRLSCPTICLRIESLETYLIMCVFTQCFVIIAVTSTNKKINWKFIITI